METNLKQSIEHLIATIDDKSLLLEAIISTIDNYELTAVETAIAESTKKLGW